MKKLLLGLFFSISFFNCTQAQIISSIRYLTCDGKANCDSNFYSTYYFYNDKCQLTDLFFIPSYITYSKTGVNGTWGGIWNEIKWSSDSLIQTTFTRGWNGFNFKKDYTAENFYATIHTFDKKGNLIKEEIKDSLNQTALKRIEFSNYGKIYDANNRLINDVDVFKRGLDKDSLQSYVNQKTYDDKGNVLTELEARYNIHGEAQYKSKRVKTYNDFGKILTEISSSYDLKGEVIYKFNTSYTYTSKKEFNGTSDIIFKTVALYQKSNNTTYYYSQKDSSFIAADGLTDNTTHYEYSDTIGFVNNPSLTNRTLDTTDKINGSETQVFQRYLSGKFVNDYKYYYDKNSRYSYSWLGNKWILSYRNDKNYGCYQLPAAIDSSTIPTHSLEWKVFPNPAFNSILIENNLPFSFSNTQVNVYNLVGKLIKTEKLGYLPFTMDVSELSTGAYIVNLQGNDATVNQKLIIQK